ncbi:hypothetical protein [Methylocucumis oryzae]|uniref:Transmembrane protein n=1 Tax=Methylocucumis oryzae TaxID=1632867 RepID=A0A0F3IM29_9GAMM|nr:hypothetical protein [Methylocucumis oryzae]KJV06604.1 hypothetical protein VZ94_10145 [Methylocucumis oryzae]
MKKLLLSILAILLLIEEWLWDVLSAFGHRLVLWLHLAKVEAWLAQTSPPIALIALLIPLLIVTPMNLAALWLLANGMIVQGIELEIVAKLLGTLLVARVFTLTKTQLLTFSWIHWLYHTITGWLRWAHEKITATAVYRNAKALKQYIKTYATKWRDYLRQWVG